VPLKQISYRIDPKQFEGRGLLYLSKEKLSAIREKIFDYQEFMEAFAARPTLDQLVEGMGTQIATRSCRTSSTSGSPTARAPPICGSSRI